MSEECKRRRELLGGKREKKLTSHFSFMCVIYDSEFTAKIPYKKNNLEKMLILKGNFESRFSASKSIHKITKKKKKILKLIKQEKFYGHFKFDHHHHHRH